MEIGGKILQILPMQSGNTQKGEWKKQEFIIETEEQFPKKVCFSLWGDKVEFIRHFKAGEKVQVSFNIESREFNGRWFTELRAWKMDKSQTQQRSQKNEPPQKEEDPFSSELTDDLPF